jgi:hypothetical protein
MTTTVVYAQTIPEEFIGEYLSGVGPVAIEAELVDYHAPWSTPDMIGTHLLYGDVLFVDDVASIQIHTMTKLICGALPACVSVNPRSVSLYSAFAWSPEYHTYIWLGQNPLTPLFDVFALDLSGADPVALWATGMFYLDGPEWIVHPYAVYSAYLVTEEHTPIVNFPLAFLW